MKFSVFEYEDYKQYLIDFIRSFPSRGRGEKSKIAKRLKCHTTYISQVLNGHSNFSIEHGEALNRYFEHRDDESEYYLLLIMKARAGTRELKHFFSKQILKIRDQQKILKNKLDYDQSLSAVDQAIYYSAWYYGAIHLLLAIPEFQNKTKLSHFLSLPQKKVSDVIDFLVTSGIVKMDAHGVYQTGRVNLFLGSDSAFMRSHHANWRMQALQSLERESLNDLHYSSAITISKKDFEKIRDILVRTIEDCRTIINHSTEEELFCFCVDLFGIGQM